MSIWKRFTGFVMTAIRIYPSLSAPIATSFFYVAPIENRKEV